MIRESIAREFAAGLAGRTGLNKSSGARAPVFLPEGERNDLIDRIETFPAFTVPAGTWDEIRNGADTLVLLAPIDDGHSVGSEIVLRDRNGKNLALFRVARIGEPTFGGEDVPLHGPVRLISLNEQ